MGYGGALYKIIMAVACMFLLSLSSLRTPEVYECESEAVPFVFDLDEDA